MKTCKCCNNILEEHMFYADKKAKDKLSYMCIQCTSKDSARRYRENRASRLVSAKEKYWADQEKHTARKRVASRNPVVKALLATRRREWGRRNPHKEIAYTMRRRAAKINATVEWLTELNALVFEEAAILAKHREVATGFRWDVDHQVPLQSKLVCGLHTFANIAVVPSSLNRAKSNRYWTDMPSIGA